MKGPETRTRVHGSPGDDAKLVHKKQKVDHRHHDSEGAPSKSRRPEPAENEHGENGQLKQHPSENFDDFLKMLKDGVSLDEIREILRENGQDSSGSDESIVHRCADQMVYGPLEACRMCGGSLELSGLNYKCLGFISWSKKYRDPSKRPKRELPPTDKPFSGMTISLSGRMSRPQVAPTLERVRDISFASQIIGDMTGSTLDDPLADRYAKLGCTLTPLEKEAEDYKMILKYLDKTFEPIKFRDGSFRVTVDNIYMLEGSGPTYQEVAKLPNKVLLWCGTGTCNLVRHISQGFLPAIFSAPEPRYMFGRGIYFTDSSAKAALYGFTAVDKKEGFLILAVASLGEKVIEMSKPPEDTEKLEKDKVGVKGMAANDVQINKHC